MVEARESAVSREVAWPVVGASVRSSCPSAPIRNLQAPAVPFLVEIQVPPGPTEPEAHSSSRVRAAVQPSESSRAVSREPVQCSE